MFWEDLLVDRHPTDDEIGTALAAAFAIPREDVAVVDGPIEDAVDANARILGERFVMAGDFPTRLSVYVRDATLERFDRMATVRRLCAELDAKCLVSDESVNPYTMILLTASGTEQAVALDPERVDDHDEYVLAKPPSRQFATPRGS